MGAVPQGAHLVRAEPACRVEMGGLVVAAVGALVAAAAAVCLAVAVAEVRGMPVPIVGLADLITHHHLS